MTGSGIYPDDLLIDRSLTPASGDILVGIAAIVRDTFPDQEIYSPLCGKN